MRILLVDQDPEFQALCASACGRHEGQIELVIEETPQHALRRLRQDEIDIVLLDHATARGDRATLAIQQFVNYAEGRPVVLAVGPDHQIEIGDWHGLGVAECIVKSRPLHEELLPKLLKRIADRASRRDRERQLGREHRLMAQVLAAVMATIDEAIVVTDRRGRLLRASSAAKPILGAREVELLGHEIDTLLTTGDGVAISARLAALEPHQRLRIERLTVCDPSGEERLLQCTIRAFPADPDTMLCLLVLENGAAVATERPPVAEIDRCPRSLADQLVALSNDLGTEGGLLAPELWHLRLDGLHRGRQAIGQRWPEMEKVVHGVIDDALRAELGSECAFDHDWHGDVIFHLPPKLGGHHFRRASRTIKLVQHAILNSSEIDQAALEADMPLPASTRQELARVEAHVRVLPLRPLGALTTERALSVAGEALLERLTAVPEAASRLLQKLSLEMSADLAMVQAHGGEPSNLQLFAPDIDAQDRISQLQILAKTEPEITHQLNLLTLSQAAGAMLEEMTGRDVFTVVDLDIEVLSHRRFAEGMIDFIGGLPEPLAQTLVLNLANMPQGFFLQRIQEIAVRLAKVSAFRSIEITDLRGQMPDLENARIPLVIVPFQKIEAQLRMQPGLLQRFIARAHEQNARVLVRGLSRKQSRQLRDDTDVDLVCRG